MPSHVQRAATRFVTRGQGWLGRYTLSYDEHYDPARTSVGRLLACNEFVLEPGAGFGIHRHAGVDIVTTVVEGVLTHVTSTGTEPRGPGSYVTPTAAGLEHDERNDGDAPVRFVQTWLLPGAPEPRPADHDLEPGDRVRLETDERLFVLVVDGEVDLDGTALSPGDSAEVQERAELVATTPAHVLVWDC